MTIPKVIREHAKAIAAWVAGVIVSVAISLFKGETAWPQTGAQWGQLLLASFIPAIAVALQPAKVTDKQVEKDPTIIRVEPPVPVAGQPPWVQ